VQHGIAAGYRGGQRICVEQVAPDQIGREAFKLRNVAGFADEQPQLRPLRRSSAGNVVADESGRACEKDFHCKIPL
jgi:hypothetical protein